MTIDTWEEPNHADPGADYATLEMLPPEDMTSLANISRLNFERGIAAWHTVRCPAFAAVSGQISAACYLSLLDACLIWSNDPTFPNVNANLILDSGATASPYVVTSGGTGMVNSATPFTAFFGEKVSTSKLFVARKVTVTGEDSPYVIYESSDYGATWISSVGMTNGINNQAIMPGGSPDKVIFFTDSGGSPVITAAGADIVTGVGIASAAHNSSGIVLMAGATNGKRSTDYGVTWSDWVVPVCPTGILNQSLSLAYDAKRTEFVLIRSGAGNLLYFTTSGDGVSWADWRQLPTNLVTNSGYIELRCTPTGIWLLFFIRANHSNTSFMESVASSIDQGLTWRCSNIIPMLGGLDAPRLYPQVVPATVNHGSYVVIANTWDSLSSSFELLVSGPLEPSLAQQSTLLG